MIAGFFNPDVTSPEPYIRAYVLLPDVANVWIPLPLLVDTGSGATCVHPHDAVHRLGSRLDDLLDTTRWPGFEVRGGVGGSAAYALTSARYAFRHDDGRVQRIDTELRIAVPTAGNQGLPSILGWDILQHFTFTADWRARIVRLEP